MAAPAAEGLPAGLQAAMEAMAGFSLADVVVHRHSAEPARLRAAAFTKGNQIHLSPGEERYLPHEAWHVVQQKQGRVRATLQAKGVAINNEQDLEREADRMGARAMVSANLERPGAGPAGLGSTCVQRAEIAPGPVPGGSLSLDGRDIAGRGDAVVQLATLDLSIDATTGSKFISEIRLDRDEVANFGTGAGDHGTAHIVFRHWAENALGGQGVAAVAGIFDDMLATVRGLPGYSRGLTPQQTETLQVKQAIAETAVAAWKTFIDGPGPKTDAQIGKRIIATAGHILNFRNGVQLSTLEFGGTGHGEGHAANRLDRLNFRIATGGATPNPAERKAALKAVVTLFDITAFSEFAENEDRHDDVDTEILPGGGAGAYETAIEQHLMQIEVTYPDLWAIIGGEAATTFRVAAHEGGDPKDLSYRPSAKK